MQVFAEIQLGRHPEQAFLCAARDLGEPRDASRPLRRINRAFGSLPYQLHHYPDLTRTFKS
jgi:hypothetical protein